MIDGQVPTASTHRRRRISLIWLVPLVTALIAGWLAWDTFSKRGPTITLSFNTAEGLQAGQSQLKFRDVTMGTVKGIRIAPDLSRVLVTVETVREATPLLTDKTVFWVVKPQLFAGNVQGLDTLLSGSYIGMLPSTAEGTPQREFVGSEDPPILQTAIPGTTFQLRTKRLGSLSLGSPIFFRDLAVGTVLGWDQSDLVNGVTVSAFVRAPFDKYVREDSLFWNASGMSLKFASGGVRVQIESMRALLLGGIAFDTPADSKAAVATADHRFPLYASADAAQSAGFGRHMEFVSYFTGSVAGLDPGAEVTFHGLKIGEVTNVDLVYDPKSDKIRVPVHFRVEAARIANIAPMQGIPAGALAAEMVRRGLRATLQAPNMLTGSKVVALVLMPEAPAAEMTREGDTFVLPSDEGGGFDSITRGASELLSKINRIDFDAIGANIASAAKGLDTTINGPELRQSLASLNATMADVKDLAHKLDADAGPALKRLPEISAQLQDALTRIGRLAGSLNTGYGDDSRFNRDMTRLMAQLSDTARSLRTLTDLLSRNPEALIQGRSDKGK
ncbi:MAG: MCE family protein [Reyranella sp.]|uniref:PqiB family protein n=1 Tax=Reyranella sp. TaxID=1929291 RepID=UPI001AD5E26D|nr:MlaD family protein [Reyranella sp.]MBN9090929.1 MCE family protein [Reyranella sp.]